MCRILNCPPALDHAELPVCVQLDYLADYSRAQHDFKADLTQTVAVTEVAVEAGKCG